MGLSSLSLLKQRGLEMKALVKRQAKEGLWDMNS